MAPAASKQATQRLMREYKGMQANPPPFIWAKPSDTNILEWHYIMRGPPDTPYEGGEYYGIVLFPADYPFAPPGLKMITPSGRFAPNSPICTSMSNFHPGSWIPSWSVATILTGLLSFMTSEEVSAGTVRSSTAERRAYAEKSHAYNITHPRFVKVFPEYAGPTAKDVPDMGDSTPKKVACPTPVPRAADKGHNKDRKPDLTPPIQNESAGLLASKKGVISVLCAGLFLAWLLSKFNEV